MKEREFSNRKKTSQKDKEEIPGGTKWLEQGKAQE